MLSSTRLSSLKHSALVSIISAAVFLAGTGQPGFEAMAEEAQQSAAQADSASPENTSSDAPALLSTNELVELVGPIALYPDELLAITLPAATYPLEVVQAARYLEKHKSNPDLKPDEVMSWMPSSNFVTRPIRREIWKIMSSKLLLWKKRPS